MSVSISLGLSARTAAAGADSRTNVFTDCHCADPVGQKFCTEFKTKVLASDAYTLAETTGGYGMGVHFSCVDLWDGIDKQLAGAMSAISVSFTIYADNLPGEVYEDSSVFRVGKDAAPEMVGKILAAVGQLAGVNTSFFERARAAAQKPSAAPAAAQTPAAPSGESGP